ncbi:MAG: MoxR family ATPase [Anaerolineales bacterium]|nr:MoxR family ATPase [Anaerolineales bacterium]
MQVVSELSKRVHTNIGHVMVGKADVVDLLLVALLCEGHALLEDVPGIGKTTLAKSLARSLGCVFSRIQFTPDLLPSDITGVSVFNQRSGEFEYRAGPLLAQVVLADEINRAGPRTQSALLEAMEERQVTVDGVTRALPFPFIVLATQNPVELEGTFPLPEAQLDRFFVRVALGYPTRNEERRILQRFRTGQPLADLKPQVEVDELRNAAQAVREVHVSPAIEDYVLDLVRATREDSTVLLGVSPRGALALYRGGQALAAVRGRSFVRPDDVKALAMPVLAHRIMLSADARLRGLTATAVIERLLGQVPVPVEEKRGAGKDG